MTSSRFRLLNPRLLLMAICMIPGIYPALAGASEAELTPWLHGKRGAVSLTFDDGIQTQFTLAVPLLNKYGIRSTFFVTTNYVRGFWDMVQKTAQDGHEIAAHTLSHPDLEIISDSVQAEEEVKGARDTIEARLPGVHCLTMAWPYGNKSPLSKRIASRYFLSSRTCGGRLETSQPQDWFDVRGVSFDSGVAVELVNSEVEKALLEGKWMVEIIHGIGTVGYKPVPVDTLKKHCDFLKEREDDIWIAPYLDVVKYSQERAAASLTITTEDSSTKVLALTDTLPDSPFDFPLTIKLSLPVDWAGAKATQGGRDLPISFRRDASTQDAFIDAVPNRGAIQVVKDGDFDPSSQAMFLSITPQSGMYAGPIDLQVNGGNHGAIQFSYLENGNPGSWSGWGGTLKIGQSSDLRVRALDANGKDSLVLTERYIIDGSQPVASVIPRGGDFDSGQTLVLNSSKLADIYYTLDGTEPSMSSAIFSYPLILTHSVRLKIMAVDMLGNRSEVGLQEYVVNGKPMPQAIPEKPGLMERTHGGGVLVDVLGKRKGSASGFYFLAKPPPIKRNARSNKQ